MEMRALIITGILVLTGYVLQAQTPIDKLQKSNSEYLGQMEKEGYEFRSQIVTEFNAENAEQNVNIRLKEGFSYKLVAMGDADVTEMDIEVKSLKKAPLESLKTGKNIEVVDLVPVKSGKFKIVLSVAQFSAAGKGFVSFMVLRK